MSTGESTLTKTHRHPSISTAQELAGIPIIDRESVRKALPGAPPAEETSFYGQYPWCLNALPTIREVVQHLSEELNKLERVHEGWQQSEVITNIFLLSCAITDAVDEYLAGSKYDFSKISQLLSFARPGLKALESLLEASSRLRTSWLFRLHCWRGSWAVAVTEFLRRSLIAPSLDRTMLLQQRDLLTSFLPGDFPESLSNYRPKIPAFFRSRDFAPSDCLELGRKYIAASPEPARPAMVMGLRTAGSFLAPLLCAYLSTASTETDWVAVRPSKGLAAWERDALRRAVQRNARVLIVDESVHTGTTVAKAIHLLRQAGFSDEDIVMLNPVEPAFPDWKNSQTWRSLSKITVLTLEPAERYKEQLLESDDAVEARLNEYFKARGYVESRILPSSKTQKLNQGWREHPPERVDVRLKRVYEVHLKDSAGVHEVRYVLAKSVGWGWLGYHAFRAGHLLAQFVPPIIGLRDGILYTEWFPEGQDAASFDLNRDAWTKSLASYVAARTRNLSLETDLTPYLAREGRHKGYEILASVLSRAYSSRIVAALKRRRIRQELAQQECPMPILTDSKMSPEEWIVGDSGLVKTDFEHHGQGKNELGMTDPAYDLADTIFHFQLSEEESAQLVRHYLQESGDKHVDKRLFLNKLLVGMCAQDRATLGIQNPRLLARRQEFHQQYISSWNFLVGETVRECGRLCHRAREIQWHTPIVVADIDGVLDRMVFGFPSTTAAGIKAISLLHAHGFAIAANTARTLREVKQYCRSYGFAGGVAEYGSVIWDGVTEQERVLVTAESLRQFEQAQSALRGIPGVFLNDDYQYSLRAFTYQDGRTKPLPRLLVQDLLASLKLDRLEIHHTGLDTAILAKEINKGSGLLSLLSFVGLPADNVFAIGDSEPDLAMFRVANRSFAPGNTSCRGEARLLGCYVADLPYQPGLLQIARKIVHPEGGTCHRCRAVDADWPKDKDLFVSLLSVADEKPFSLLLRNSPELFALSAVFKK